MLVGVLFGELPLSFGGQIALSEAALKERVRDADDLSGEPQPERLRGGNWEPIWRGGLLSAPNRFFG